MKIKPDKLYKVEWLDICSHSNEVLRKPYNKFLAPSWTIGYLQQSQDTVIVIYGGNDTDSCFDAIPKKVITNITPL